MPSLALPCCWAALLQILHQERHHRFIPDAVTDSPQIFPFLSIYLLLAEGAAIGRSARKSPVLRTKHPTEGAVCAERLPSCPCSLPYSSSCRCERGPSNYPTVMNESSLQQSCYAQVRSLFSLMNQRPERFGTDHKNPVDAQLSLCSQQS